MMRQKKRVDKRKGSYSIRYKSNKLNKQDDLVELFSDLQTLIDERQIFVTSMRIWTSMRYLA